MTNAQERRREQRAAKQAEWKAANPLLVGVSAKPVRQTITLKRKAMDRVAKAVETETEYHKQILKAAEAYTGPNIEAGSICIPQVAMYQAGHRKSENITAR